jgi:hypothetical protein
MECLVQKEDATGCDDKADGPKHVVVGRDWAAVERDWAADGGCHEEECTKPGQQKDEAEQAE